MRVTFTFSNLANIQSKTTAKIKSHVNVPDEIVHLIGVEERIREIGHRVGILSRACVHLTCKELGIVDEQMNDKQIDENDTWFWHSPNIIGLYFRTHRNSETLRIIAPHNHQEVGVPDYMARKVQRGKRKKGKARLSSNVWRMQDNWVKTDSQREYYDSIKSIADQMLILLNSKPNPYGGHLHWIFDGFHPFWSDSTVAKLLKKERDRLWNLENKPEKPKHSKKHGQGNRPGAIPGKFMGVQMRSQLEIRFATEVQARGIEWIYEEERLGEGNYLVDFHLPKLKMWVEVKGKFEARDHYLLKDVAETLQERGESLYVFTSGSPMEVTSDAFEKIPRKQFWQLLESLK